MEDPVGRQNSFQQNSYNVTGEDLLNTQQLLILRIIIDTVKVDRKITLAIIKMLLPIMLLQVHPLDRWITCQRPGKISVSKEKNSIKPLIRDSTHLIDKLFLYLLIEYKYIQSGYLKVLLIYTRVYTQ